ncbi:uncharacterized protein J7T54_001577 [Emericellopsis cladophorae]|uniref:D-xylose 1-dehydrogenase (NADP(+), D-xylono-1,5-lactone-forming) n=1 Tax=Emericellopsis cladophorae TaxID=2686198 RepID=A0A9P9Y574_9HYPO|nr:uncharacterized protein J7T54_001577 [Emericellopsis cladophorae]KAI6783701.1 hypothetical protein J7T54_001577 [Emericellopsis cladophorae]
MPELPNIRWGIIATGLISSWFVEDIVRTDRPPPQATHTIRAIGSSSLQKGKDFVAKHIPQTSPTIYGSYEEVYNDPNVDVIYIGTPHAFHKKNCLDAISAGKHVLCEKAFTLTAKEAREVFEAARAKGVYVMEAMWTRHFPLIKAMQKVLHEEKAIGKVQRAFCDFAIFQDIASKGPESRLKNPALGAGSLLDIGIYSLTLTILGLEPALGKKGAAETPAVRAIQSLSDGVDVSTAVLLLYKDGRQGIATSHSDLKSGDDFCRVEGSEGTLIVHGPAASVPSSFTVVKRGGGEKKYEFERPGRGFYWEADAVAVDVQQGRTESLVMPWSETIRFMEIMDEVRRQGGARFPQDER